MPDDLDPPLCDCEAPLLAEDGGCDRCDGELPTRPKEVPDGR